MLKCGYRGTFQWYRRKRAQRSVYEFAGRQDWSHNWRVRDTDEMLDYSLVGPVGKRLTYAGLIESRELR